MSNNEYTRKPYGLKAVKVNAFDMRKPLTSKEDIETLFLGAEWVVKDFKVHPQYDFVKFTVTDYRLDSVQGDDFEMTTSSAMYVCFNGSRVFELDVATFESKYEQLCAECSKSERKPEQVPTLESIMISNAIVMADFIAGCELHSPEIGDERVLTDEVLVALRTFTEVWNRRTMKYD